jgi:hypothetical protein
MLPMLMGPATATTAAWAAMIGRLVGSLLFAVAAFVPRTGLLRPRPRRLGAAGGASRDRPGGRPRHRLAALGRAARS